MPLSAQSQLDPGHSTRSGLGRSILTGVQSSPGNVLDQVSAQELAFTQSGGAFGVDADGPYFEVLAPSNWLRVPAGAGGSAPFSIFVRFKPVVAGMPPWSVVTGTTTATADRFKLQAYNDTNDMVCYVPGESRFVGGKTGFTQAVQGLLVVYDGTNFRLYRQGRPVVVGTPTPAPTNDARVLSAIAGDTHATNPASWPGRYYEWATWNRALTPAEAQLLADNPDSRYINIVTAPPADPSNVLIADAGIRPDGFDVSWTLGTGGATPTGAQVQVRTPARPASDVTGWAAASGGTLTGSAPTQASLAGLESDTEYDVAVIVTGEAGNSARVMAPAPVTTLNGATGGGEVPPEPVIVPGTAPSFITAATLPTGTAGVDYVYDLQGTGSGTLVYSAGTGGLPAGWGLTAGGRITRTGPALGSYSIPVVLTGDTAPAAQRTFVVTIAAPSGTAPVFISPATLANGAAGTAYSLQLAASGTGALTYSLGTGAPAGWSVSASGLLTHPGAAAGTYSVPVTVTGDTAPPAQRTFSITIAAAASPILADRMGLLLPLYIYPGAVWQQINAQAATVETIVIANPASGPGTVADANYTSAIAAARAAGARVVGYVSTSFSNRAAAAIKADVDRWTALYGPIDGIFLDEFTNADASAAVAFYKDLRDYIKAQQPGYLVIGNPGSQIPESYMATADVLTVFENTAANFASYTAPAWAAKYDGKRFAALVHDAPNQAAMSAAVARMGAQNIGYGYVTSDVMPNPWDALPAYYDAEAAALHAQQIVQVTTPPAPVTPTPGPIGSRFVTIPRVLRDNASLAGASVTYFVLRPGQSGALDMVSSGAAATVGSNGALEVNLPSDATVPAGAAVLVGALVGPLTIAGLADLRRDMTMAVVQQR